MQSDLGGEALLLYRETNPAQRLFPCVGVQRTNQEKREGRTGAGFEAEVKIKLASIGQVFALLGRL